VSAPEPAGPLIQEYAEAASAHGEATAAGDNARANQAHEVVAATYRRLRSHGEQRRLLPLLEHSDPAVVAWAAAHALEFAPKEGERALTDLAQRDSGIISFAAEVTLSEWREGKLAFP
jgi:hypothetical protein